MSGRQKQIVELSSELMLKTASRDQPRKPRRAGQPIASAVPYRKSAGRAEGPPRPAPRVASVRGADSSSKVTHQTEGYKYPAEIHWGSRGSLLKGLIIRRPSAEELNFMGEAQVSPNTTGNLISQGK